MKDIQNDIGFDGPPQTWEALMRETVLVLGLCTLGTLLLGLLVYVLAT